MDLIAYNVSRLINIILCFNNDLMDISVLEIHTYFKQ